MFKTTYHSPIGWLEIVATTTGIYSLYFYDEQPAPDSATPDPATAALLDTAQHQIAEYFAGQRHTFDLPLDLHGTSFQLKVWQELLNIPYGKTISYLDLARALNNEKAIRAVGGANGRNPVSLIVPCHRVIGNNGKLVGYGGGLWRKEWLLNHEQTGRPLLG